MPNILFLSKNKLFQNDLAEQINLCLSDEYKIYFSEDENIVFDIAILDGRVFLEDFRLQHPKTPALVLEPTDSEFFTENSLDIFMFKPLILSEILNKIQTGRMVFENSEDGFLFFGDYELHPRDKEIINIKTKRITKLTEREVNILQYLYQSQGKLVSKNELLQNVWEYNTEVTTHTIETHIYRLRKKVEVSHKDSQLIKAEEGSYQLLI